MENIYVQIVIWTLLFAVIGTLAYIIFGRG